MYAVFYIYNTSKLYPDFELQSIPPSEDVFVNEPSSFTFVCTKNSYKELESAIKSLTLHHARPKIYIGCDKYTYQKLSNIDFDADIKWFSEWVESYSDLKLGAYPMNTVFRDFLKMRPKINEDCG